MVEKTDTGARGASTRRKVTALMAGGLVLGVGAAVTLAAWNDSEFATSDFTAGSFVFQGSEDGTTWADHAVEGDAAQLTFTQGFDNLTPGDVVYAPFALQLTDDSTSPADLTAVPPAASGTLADNLSFASVATTEFGCDADAFTDGTAVPTDMQPGDQVNLCLQVAVDDDVAQGETGTVLWQWNAESQ